MAARETTSAWRWLAPSEVMTSRLHPNGVAQRSTTATSRRHPPSCCDDRQRNVVIYRDLCDSEDLRGREAWRSTDRWSSLPSCVRFPAILAGSRLTLDLLLRATAPM